jgi:hypothetical protein
MEKPGQYTKQQVDASLTIHLQYLCKLHVRGTSAQAGDTVTSLVKPVTKPGGLPDWWRLAFSLPSIHSKVVLP